MGDAVDSDLRLRSHFIAVLQGYHYPVSLP